MKIKEVEQLTGITKANIRYYESLHETLLYTDEKQDFDLAVDTFRKISDLLFEVEE